MKTTETLQKIKDFIITKLSIDERTSLEGMLPKDTATPDVPQETPKAEEPTKMSEVKTKDGLVFSFDGDMLMIGTPIMDITSGTPTPVADGEYTLEDGSNITVINSAVAEMSTAEEKSTEVETPIVEAAKKPMYMASQSEVAELKKQVLLLSKVVNEILETPINNQVVTPAKDWSELTALEKFRLTK